MLVGYLLCFYLEFTGVIGHEWLGVGLGVLAIIHTWLHWDWVVAVTKRFFAAASSRSRWFYLLDILIVFGFVVIFETGLVISTWLNLDFLNYVTWLEVHTYASYATLAMLFLKIGLHWRWVVNTTNKIFALGKRSIPVRGVTPVLVPVQVNKEVVGRRHFLGLMGVVGLGSALAVINVVRENSAFTSIAENSVSAMGISETATSSTPQVSTVEPTAQTTQQAVEETQVASVTNTEPVAAALPTAEPTAIPTQETQAAVAACQVRCPKGCSFPGRCRRYVDQNNNNLCDLGECL